MPDFTDYSMKGRTYRYFTQEPLYPFGFGLTYGDVRIKEAVASETAERISLEVTLHNNGTATDEVVQAYVQNEHSANAPVNPRLCAFERIHVEQGEEKKVRLEIPKTQFRVVNEDG